MFNLNNIKFNKKMSETKRRGRPLGSKNKPKIELKKTNGGSYVLNIKMEKQSRMLG